MKRWVALVLVLLPHCAGCLYYAYPTIIHIPDLSVPDPDGSVKAFRVDIDRTDHAPAPPIVQYTLADIRVDSRGQVPGQLEVAPATGLYDPFQLVKNTPHERSEYTMVIRLYRSKFNTQEVKSWERTHELSWVPARDLLAQEKAIDDLLAPPAAPGEIPRGNWWDLKDQKSPGLGLQVGMVNHMHREALLFAAGEYQRLLDSRDATLQGAQAIRDRLRNKAQYLKGFAERPQIAVVP